MNTFFMSEFSYCPLVWMCCNRSLNTKINRLHERCLRIVHNDKRQLLVKDGSVSIHYQNLQKLAVEIFKVSRGLSPEVVNKLFQFREQIPYELRQRCQFQILWVHSVFSGTESLKSLGQKVWALLPDETVGESREIQKCNKTMETYILSLRTMQEIYSQDWVSLKKKCFQE